MSSCTGQCGQPQPGTRIKPNRICQTGEGRWTIEGKLKLCYSLSAPHLPLMTSSVWRNTLGGVWPMMSSCPLAGSLHACSLIQIVSFVLLINAIGFRNITGCGLSLCFLHAFCEFAFLYIQLFNTLINTKLCSFVSFRSAWSSGVRHSHRTAGEILCRKKVNILQFHQRLIPGMSGKAAI